jgi:hypothetical protein
VVRLSNHGLCAHNSLVALVFVFLATLGLVSTKCWQQLFSYSCMPLSLKQFARGHANSWVWGRSPNLQYLLKHLSSTSLSISNIFSSSQPVFFFFLDLVDQLPFSSAVLNLSLPHLQLSTIHIMFPHIFHHVLHSFHFCWGCVELHFFHVFCYTKTFIITPFPAFRC